MAKAARKKSARPSKKQMEIIDAKRARAYSAMESHVCDLMSMGTLAMDQFDKDEGLFIFAVGKLEEMLTEFKKCYYAEEFLS
jgi:hypothetical protein